MTFIVINKKLKPEWFLSASIYPLITVTEPNSKT